MQSSTTSCQAARPRSLKVDTVGDQVLSKLAVALEKCRQDMGKSHLSPADHHITFVKEGQASTGVTPIAPPKAVLATQDCNMRVDLDRKLHFPREITSTSLRPDIVMWSSSIKNGLFIELTILWEAGIEVALEKKTLKYLDLAAESREAGWRTIFYPVEVGCRGSSALRLMRDMGITEANQQKALKMLAEEAEKSNFA